MAISNKSQIPKRTKVKKLGNEELGLEETQRREAIIKSNLEETENVSPNQRSAADIRGGFKGELAEQERIKEAERRKRDALVNAAPGQQPANTAQTGNQQTEQTEPSTQTAAPKGEFSGVGEVIKRGAAALGPLTPGPTPQFIQDAGSRGIEDVRQSKPLVLGVTAKIADAARTAFTGKSSKQLTSAEEVMNTYMAALAEDITLMEQGQKSPEDVAENIRQAQSSITRYETNLVGEGRRNLNFWIDEGARIEANTLAQKDKLEDFKKRFVNAGL